jgi:hypothetical protein
MHGIVRGNMVGGLYFALSITSASFGISSVLIHLILLGVPSSPFPLHPSRWTGSIRLRSEGISGHLITAPLAHFVGGVESVHEPSQAKKN